MGEAISARTSSGDAESSCSASESSKWGSEGSEGMSVCSIASMRRHMREGVSSTVAINQVVMVM